MFYTIRFSIAFDASLKHSHSPIEPLRKNAIAICQFIFVTRKNNMQKCTLDLI